jgi:Transposase domain (DUF772)
LMEQLDYNFLFRWFVGLYIDDPVWYVTVFTKNRERLLVGEVAQDFFTTLVAQGLLSNKHFTVDGTLMEAWAGHKSFKRKGDDRQTPPDDPGNPSVNFHGERRTNATHQSTTDPEARLARKGSGKEARLCYGEHVQMDNRLGAQHSPDSGHRPAHGGFNDGGRDRGPWSGHAGRRQGYDQKELVAGVSSHSARCAKKSAALPMTSGYHVYLYYTRVNSRKIDAYVAH